MTSKLLTQKREELKKKREDSQAIMTEAGDGLNHEAKGLNALTGREFKNGGELAEFIRQGFAELDDLQKEVSDLKIIESAVEENNKVLATLDADGKIKHPPATKDNRDPYGIKGYTQADVEKYKGKTFGVAVLETLLDMTKGASVFTLNNKGDFEVDIPIKMVEEAILKTTMTTSAGWDPEDIRIARTIFDAQRPAPVVVNIFPTFPTTMSTILFMEETTFTNSAAEASEDADQAESALAYTEQSSEVRKIGHTLPVTEEQLDDVPGLRAIIDQRLTFMVQQRLDLQVLVGDGSAPNISGVHDRVGINVQAKASDSNIVAARKAINTVEVTGFANPDWFVFHPTDWMNIRLLQTADGNFLFGPPSMPGADTLWGLPVVRSTAQTITQALVGDFANFSALYIRRGITLSITDSHSAEFIKDVLRIKANMRAALAVFRPAAFTEITGL